MPAKFGTLEMPAGYVLIRHGLFSWGWRVRDAKSGRMYVAESRTWTATGAILSAIAHSQD